MNNTLINDQQIRELLNPSLPVKLEKSLIVESSSSLINTILNTNTLDSYEETKQQLTTLYDNLKGVFDYAKVPYELRDRQFLNKTGFAMSPSDAITTINDVFRVSGFIRAVNAAIKDLKKKGSSKKLKIIYPACGPLAPLLFPLLAYYKQTQQYNENDFEVTFIDIQEGAVVSLLEVLKVSGLLGFVKEILLIDATDYVGTEKFDLVILEAMQHGFTKEGHLSISKHFSSMLHDDGIFLPQEISIKAVLADGEEEYNTQWKDESDTFFSSIKKDIQEKRKVLGEILKVNLETLKAMELLKLNVNTHLVKCSSYLIPFFEQEENNKTLLFTTNVVIYKDEVLNEYDSGITHPLPNLDICINFIPQNEKRETDLYVNSGDTLTFYYKLIGLPGFLVTKGDI